MVTFLEERLQRREEAGNLRRLRVEQPVIDFSSSDYLGLARSSDLAAFVFQEWQRYGKHLNGLGSTGSRLLTGNTAYAQELEESIALFHGYEAGLLFNCGYMANVGLLSLLGGDEDAIFFDAAVHASLRDGMRLSCCKTYPFRHHDVEHLESRLSKSSAKGERFICVESIYSTDGSRAPLSDICRLARQYNARLIVDEAHAVGVSGPCGRGIVAEENLMGDVFAQVVTFSKGLGVHGAIVLGSNTLIQAMVNFSTSYIYTTALPFHALAAIKGSYALFPDLEEERKHLQRLIQIFQNAAPYSSPTHIQAVVIEGNEQVRRAATGLAAQGFDVRALTSPTVQQGHEMLRICLHAFNTEEELKALLQHL